MRVHLDALGWLHVLAGSIGALTGVAFLLLAVGTAGLDVDPERQAGLTALMWLLLAAGGLFIFAGALMVATGRGLVARRPNARLGALMLAVPGLCALPFGTALAVYTLWALLNDDARAAFGRPLRGTAASS